MGSWPRRRAALCGGRRWAVGNGVWDDAGLQSGHASNGMQRGAGTGRRIALQPLSSKRPSRDSEDGATAAASAPAATAAACSRDERQRAFLLLPFAHDADEPTPPSPNMLFAICTCVRLARDKWACVCARETSTTGRPFSLAGPDHLGERTGLSTSRLDLVQLVESERRLETRERSGDEAISGRLLDPLLSLCSYSDSLWYSD